jgi:hypothetical protein
MHVLRKAATSADRIRSIRRREEFADMSTFVPVSAGCATMAGALHAFRGALGLQAWEDIKAK